MITRLKVSACDLSIEVEGNEYSDVQEALEEVLGNPDIRFKAGLPLVVDMDTLAMRTPEGDREKQEVGIEVDGEIRAIVSVKKTRTCSSRKMRTPETEGDGEIPFFLDGLPVASVTPSPRPRCAWCGKGLGGTDWVRVTLADGKTSFRLCHVCERLRAETQAFRSQAHENSRRKRKEK